jgi:peroxiredoxin
MKIMPSRRSMAFGASKKVMGRKYTGINRMPFLVGIDGKIKQVM